MKKFYTLLLFSLLLSCQQQDNGWQKVEALSNTLCTDNKTEYTTNHQGEHTLNDCFVYTFNDTLHICFPAGLPAYWLGAKLQVAAGMFNATVDGVPFIPNVKLTFQVKKQRLCLNKQSYAIGDTLQGYIELVFEERDKAHNQSNEFYFKGCIYKIVREKDYQAFQDDEAIMSYSLNHAINELGEPLDDYTFTTNGLPEFRIELLNIFPPSDSIYIRELTWNTSDDAQVTDGGIFRLTVWYAQKDGVWQPVYFLRWDTFTQF